MKKINESINKIFKYFYNIKYIKSYFREIYFVLFWWSLGFIFWFFFYLGNAWFSWTLISVPAYAWGINSTIALGALILFWYLKNKIKHTSKKYLQLKYIIFLFLIAISLKQIMFLIRPELWFIFTSVTNQYVDKKTGDINNVEEYTKLTFKYCLNWKYKWCSSKFAEDFQTIEDYMYVLNFANKNNYRDLYRFTIDTAEKQWKLEELIEKYNNKTFYVFITKQTSDISILNIINSQNIDNKTRKFIATNISHLLYWSKNIESLSVKKANLYSNNFNKQINQIIKDMEDVNISLFIFY